VHVSNCLKNVNAAASARKYFVPKGEPNGNHGDGHTLQGKITALTVFSPPFAGATSQMGLRTPIFAVKAVKLAVNQIVWP
jgi:hypothetical protein